jgi:hypothetical protein
LISNSNIYIFKKLFKIYKLYKNGKFGYPWTRILTIHLAVAPTPKATVCDPPTIAEPRPVRAEPAAAAEVVPTPIAPTAAEPAPAATFVTRTPPAAATLVIKGTSMIDSRKGIYNLY